MAASSTLRCKCGHMQSGHQHYAARCRIQSCDCQEYELKEESVDRVTLTPAQEKLAKLLEELVDPWSTVPDPDELVLALSCDDRFEKIVGELTGEFFKMNVAKFFYSMGDMLEATKQTPEG